MNKNIIVRPNQLAQELNVSLCTLWRWRQQKRLPQPLQLGPRLVGWRREVIDIWLAEMETSNNNGGK